MWAKSTGPPAKFLYLGYSNLCVDLHVFYILVILTFTFIIKIFGINWSTTQVSSRFYLVTARVWSAQWAENHGLNCISIIGLRACEVKFVQVNGCSSCSNLHVSRTLVLDELLLGLDQSSCQSCSNRSMELKYQLVGKRVAKVKFSRSQAVSITFFRGVSYIFTENGMVPDKLVTCQPPILNLRAY